MTFPTAAAVQVLVAVLIVILTAYAAGRVHEWTAVQQRLPLRVGVDHVDPAEQVLQGRAGRHESP